MLDLMAVELNPVRGHIRFNRFLISELFNRKALNSFVTTEEIVHEYSDLIGREQFFKVYKDKFSFRVSQFFNHIKLAALIISKRKTNILLLSYYPPYFFMFSYLFELLGAKLFVIEHNTVPLNGDSWIKKLIYRSISSRVTHICLSDHIAEHIQSRYSKQAIIWPHPLIKQNKYTRGRRPSKSYVFCPGKNVKTDEIKWLSGKLEDKGISILCKQNVAGSCVVFQPFFDNYDELIKYSKVVFSPVDYEFRVSGVAFEAIAHGKNVVCKRTKFGLALRKRFPGNVIFTDDENFVHKVEAAADTFTNCELDNSTGVDALVDRIGHL